MGKLALYSQNVALGCETGNRAYIDQADIYYNQAMDDWERANEMLKDLQ